MKKINIVLFGTGKVGSVLINQVLEARESLLRQENLELNLPVIANSTTAFFRKENQEATWETDLKTFGFPYQLQDILDYVAERGYENLVAVDATASEEFVGNYFRLIQSGFHIVAANKIANSKPIAFYNQLRNLLRENDRFFLYETNVGAGLPIIETLRNLHRSNEKVLKIRGVFSGSLSYIFNHFSSQDRPFSEILTEAADKGFTEPDPREDLSGKDVARKLLILARELGLQKEFEEISVTDLVPHHLNGGSTLAHFQRNKSDLDPPLESIRAALAPGEVIRHVGELDIASGSLKVGLSKEPRESALGSLRESDASFEIHTASYGAEPRVIRGAGAGTAVTARGILTDLIKLAEKLT